MLTGIKVIIGLVAAAVLLSFCVPMRQTAAYKAPINVSMQRAIGLGKAIRFWSLDNDGNSPPSLRDPGFVEQLGKPIEELLYRDPETDRLMDWLYFPRRMDAGAGEILIASPISSNGARIVVFVDMSGAVMKNEEFEAIYPEAKLK